MKHGKLSLIFLGKLLVLIIGVVLFVSILFSNYYNLKKPKSLTQSQKERLIQTKLNEQSTNWREYKNDKYKISYFVPPLLHLNEIENPTDYEFFVVHEENQYSKDYKGVGFGVSKRKIEEEYNYISKKFLEDDKNINIDRREINTDILKGVLMDITGSQELEDRSVLITANGEYTYSISTVPDQIGDIIKTLKFL